MKLNLNDGLLRTSIKTYIFSITIFEKYFDSQYSLMLARTSRPHYQSEQDELVLKKKNIKTITGMVQCATNLGLATSSVAFR